MAQDPSQASLKELVSSAVADLQRLVKAQVELAKWELQQTGQAAAKTSLLVLIALTMAGLGGIFLLVTIAYVLVALGLPVWAGFGIVTIVLFLVAAVVGFLGYRSSQTIKGLPKTVAEIEQTKAAISSAMGEPAETFTEIDVTDIDIIEIDTGPRDSRPTST